MLTFLPYPDFYESAQALDDLRLGNQRIKNLIILKAISKAKNPFKNHLGVLMWNGYSRALLAYHTAICEEWEYRGHSDTTLTIARTIFKAPTILLYTEPEWVGDDRLHSSHRSNLLVRDPYHYSRFCWNEPNNLPYFWPTENGYPSERPDVQSNVTLQPSEIRSILIHEARALGEEVGISVPSPHSLSTQPLGRQ